MLYSITTSLFNPISKPWPVSGPVLIKGNFDAAFNAKNHSTISCIILHNYECQVMAVCSYPNNNVGDSMMAEAYVALEAVTAAEELGFRKLILEGDCLTIIKKINGNMLDQSTLSTIVHNIRFRSKKFKYFTYFSLEERRT